MQPETFTLDVPGAALHYEVRGTGPVLLLICGGIYDAAGYSELARRLADRYTVVTYDRRGNSRSPLTGPPEKQRIEVHADDAHRVLAAVTDQPAYVFGNSSGASIGLALAATHPGQVRTLVAHEPPVFEVLPDRDHWRDVLRQVADAYAAGGVPAAGEVFGAAMRMSHAEPAGEPSPEVAAMVDRISANMDFFFGYEVPGFATYQPDLDALRSGPARVVPAAGTASQGEPPNRVSYALAELLGSPVAELPGDHGGFGAEADGFAAALDKELSAA